MENQQILLYTMAVFTAVAAIALIIQMLTLFGIYRTMKALQQRSSTFLDRWEPVADTSLKTLEQVRDQSNQILGKVNDIADTTKEQVARVDTILDDVSEFSKKQLSRVDHTMEGVMDRLAETTVAVQKTVLVPVRQVRALAIGLSAAAEALFGPRRQTVDRATLDEEMFI